MKPYLFRNKEFEFLCDTNTGYVSIGIQNECNIKNMYAMVKDDNQKIYKTTDFLNHICKEETIHDEIGITNQITINNFNDKSFSIIQKFSLYDQGFLTVGVSIISEQEFSTNYMAPVFIAGLNGIETSWKQIQFISAPFDNDKWDKFITYPIEFAKKSFEFTAIYNQSNHNGLIIGSIDHDKWKTAIKIKATRNKIRGLEVYSGEASEQTRDFLNVNHGSIKGKNISSARIFIGYNQNYRDGLESFGRVNACVKAPLIWEGGVIFGWNSWAAMMNNLSYDSFIIASDFMKTIQDKYHNKREVYINFDAFWKTFENKMEDAVAYVKNNNQKAGIYLSPYVTYTNILDNEVPGNSGKYIYRDLLLRGHNGEVLPAVDGLLSIDPTHPGTINSIVYETERIIKWGFEYVKMDFLGHAAREGEFFDKSISTGIQAYNFGMKILNDCLSMKRAGFQIFISLSIAPIFPHGYGHARRISCDAFGSIDQSAYLNNCTTYLWWMNNCLYRFNDPDHIVLYKAFDKVSTTFYEARTRFNSAVVCGTVMINSDDYAFPQARERANQLLTNEAVNDIARKGSTFKPLSGNYGEFPADIFIRNDDSTILVAFFNYSISHPKKISQDLSALGLNNESYYEVKDLWSNKCSRIKSKIKIKLNPADSTIIEINVPTVKANK